jgi:hypothetical protein
MESVLSLSSQDTGGVVSIDLIAASYRLDTFPKEWPQEKRALAKRRYYKFLGLKQDNLFARLAPTHDIDEMWHLHMLSPIAYHRDCMRLFGKILDHDGGFGKGPGESEQLQRVFARTAELWELTYNEPYLESGQWMKDAMIDCWHDCSDRCWHACSDVEP